MMYWIRLVNKGSCNSSFSGYINKFLLFSFLGLAACGPSSTSQKNFMDFTESQLTFDAEGHLLNTTQVFSMNDEWIVFDGRNYDSLIGSTSSISIVDTRKGESKKIYQTANASEWGPGVGAATFSPVEDRVLFIHGIRNARKEKPYSFTRRTGVAVDINHPFQPIFFDARDIVPPFTNGALRGGTHAHTWSGDGQWISFTYNDFVLEQAARENDQVEDLRTVGVMVPGKKVTVEKSFGDENNNGEMFAFLVVPVVPKPMPGSDEVKKAFDETWIGKNGYIKPDGSHQNKSIAYQGQVVDENGSEKVEVFVADIPDDILQTASGEDLRGTATERPKIPRRITRRRITFTKNGVSSTPRHWLRTDPQGTKIAFLAKDEKGIVQLMYVSPNNTKEAPYQVTHLSSSIQGPFNFSPDGKRVAYLSDNSVFITNMENGESFRITPASTEENKPVGPVNWSNDGSMLAYNRYVQSHEGRFLQIFLLKENKR